MASYFSLDDRSTDEEKLSEAACLKDQAKHRVSISTASRLRKYAIAVSWVSVVFPLVSGIAAIVLSDLEESQSLFGYGLDAILDSMSSMVVIWRFYGNLSVLYSFKKERIACIIVAFLFFVAAACLIGKSIFALVTYLTEKKSESVLIFAIITGVVSLMLAIMKMYLGYELESRVLVTDSVITFTGAAVSFAGCFSMLAFENDSRLWYLDPLFGIICGCFLLIVGTKLLIDMVCRYKDPTQKEDNCS